MKKKDEVNADLFLRRFAVALANEPPDFPTEFSGAAELRRYLADRYGDLEQA